jgi:glucokinase
MQRTRAPTDRLLVADIGGTNARFAVADLDKLELSHIHSTPCCRHASLQAALSAYLAELGFTPGHAALAVAAPVKGEQIRLTNSHWRFVKDELCHACGFEHILVVNDFEALALSLPTLDSSDLVQIGGTLPLEHATKVVLGPGTGLGVAALVWSGDRWIAVPGEGGHMSIGASDGAELALLAQLSAPGTRPSAENAISGPGLVAIYRAIAARRNAPVPPTVDVVQLALHGGDVIADEVMQLFSAWLGRFAGDVALVFGARGGVYIGGGIAPKITAMLSAGRFRETFEQKGRMRAYLAPIPVYVIAAEFATLKGAAVALRSKFEHGAVA